MRTSSFLALTAALTLPGPALAQEFSDAVEILTAQRPIDPSLAGDDSLTCDQIRGELSARNQEISSLMGSSASVANGQMKAQEIERKAAVAADTARDIANSMAPAGLAPGNAIEAAADRAIAASRKAREVKDLADIGAISGKVQFAARRIPHLHKLYGGKCGAGAGQ